MGWPRVARASESCADAGFTVDCDGQLVQSGTLEDSSGDIVEGGGEADITSYYAYAAASQEDCDATDGQAIE